MIRVLRITLAGSLAALCGCATAVKQPFDARRCAHTCSEMADACKASCLRSVDPNRSRSGSGDACERTCQTQRDTCDVQCLHGKEPAF
jgi:hypothetical protein